MRQSTGMRYELGVSMFCSQCVRRVPDSEHRKNNTGGKLFLIAVPFQAAGKQSKMLSGLRNSQPKTLNVPLCRSAAESAGQRRGDVGSDHLLGRFFGHWFLAG